MHVRREKEIQESVEGLIFDDEMDDIARACIEDGNWNALIQVQCSCCFFLSTVLVIHSTLMKCIRIPSFIFGFSVKIER